MSKCLQGSKVVRQSDVESFDFRRTVCLSWARTGHWGGWLERAVSTRKDAVALVCERKTC